MDYLQMNPVKSSIDVLVYLVIHERIEQHPIDNFFMQN